jgi:hypothetical protein
MNMKTRQVLTTHVNCFPERGWAGEMARMEGGARTRVALDESKLTPSSAFGPQHLHLWN